MSSADFQLPTDHGYVVVEDQADGTKKVIVCDGVTAGQPQNAIAIHFKCTSLRVHSGVRMERSAAGTAHTRKVVEVFAESRGVVHLRALNRDASPILQEEARLRR
jgi:hypothetical protein